MNMFNRLGIGGPKTKQQHADEASAKFEKAQAAQKKRSAGVDHKSMFSSQDRREERVRKGQRAVEDLARENQAAQASNVRGAVSKLGTAVRGYGRGTLTRAKTQMSGMRQRAKDGTSCMSDCKNKCKEKVGTLLGGKRRRTKRRRKSRKRKTKRNTKRRRKSRKRKTKRRRRR
jgi:hypothetical protein